MPKTMIFQGKTTNEAIEKGLKEFHVSKDKVEIKVLAEEKRSFFSILDPRVVKVEMTLKEDKSDNKRENKEEKEEITEQEVTELKNKVEEFLNNIIKTLPSAQIQYKIKYENKYINISINGQDLNYLIGYRGETLNAFQTILSSFVSNHTKHHIKVILDIGDYKEKRKNTLENLAVRTANNVISTGKSITLEPMHPYERKIIHSKLQENNKVKTHSVGEEPYRKVVISLAGKKV